MRSRITIQRNTPVQDGFGEPDEGWADLAFRSASKEPLPGREGFGSDLNYAEHPTVFRFRYGSDIGDLKADDRVVHRGVNYDLVSVHNVEDRNEWFEVVGVIRG